MSIDKNIGVDNNFQMSEINLKVDNNLPIEYFDKVDNNLEMVGVLENGNSNHFVLSV